MPDGEDPNDKSHCSISDEGMSYDSSVTTAAHSSHSGSLGFRIRSHYVCFVYAIRG